MGGLIVFGTREEILFGLIHHQRNLFGVDDIPAFLLPEWKLGKTRDYPSSLV
ncbi:unnamed protein product [Tenebrio molitor]|nr:unnamed protein product [Tenebrio molitor]